jgi:hypothetical protein
VIVGTEIVAVQVAVGDIGGVWMGSVALGAVVNTAAAVFVVREGD